jgi:hypothetical protein
MRRRALLVVLLAGAFAAAGGIALGSPPASSHDAPASPAAIGRADVADGPTPSALARTFEGLSRDHDTRGDVAVAIGIALALALAGGWWLARERAARHIWSELRAVRRTRAPPWTPATVHC